MHAEEKGERRGVKGRTKAAVERGTTASKTTKGISIRKGVGSRAYRYESSSSRRADELGQVTVERWKAGWWTKRSCLHSRSLLANSLLSWSRAQMYCIGGSCSSHMIIARVPESHN
jgi:hypothetical protein